MEMNDDDRKIFGEYVKRLRQERQLSLRAVEKAVGISNSYLYQIERGERNAPKIEILRKMAALYDVNYDSLLVAARLNDPKDDDTFHERLDEVAALLENAFEFVRKDKDFRYGTYMTGDKLTPEAKRFIVEVYQEMTGTQLLKTIKKGEKK